MLTRLQRTALDNCILAILAERGQSIRASELSEHLQVAQRDVVGRLQALKHRGMVDYERDATQPYAAGHWSISEQGQQAINEMTPSPAEADVTGADDV